MRLKADLRVLIDGEETTRMSDSVMAGTSTFDVENVANFNVNEYVVIGLLGAEDAELHRIIGITGNSINVTTSLEFPHAQDTAIISVPYNGIFFYHSTTLVSTLVPLNVLPQIIQPEGTYNVFEDVVNTDGYGWYRFYNAYTNVQSDLSNAVPYAGFAENSVKNIFDNFLTQIQNREKTLIKDKDMFAWLNEGYSKARNALNLNNREYSVPTPTTFTITSGITEYDLPAGFTKARMVTNAQGLPINDIPVEESLVYTNNSVNSSNVKYYIRGTKIGFVPTATTGTTYYLYYTKIGATLTSYNDLVELPNNNYYFLIDFMLYRATPIIGGNAQTRMATFTAGINELIVTSQKRDGDPDSMGISPSAVV